jgi:N,N'-diacetyllegionaminate synthase
MIKMKAPTDFRDLEHTFIVAEIGVNHEGDPARATEMVRLAAEAGVDAVKFQTYVGQGFVSNADPERRARSAGFSLSRNDFSGLAKTAAECGVVFFSTPLDLESVDFLDDLAPIFKIASGDLTFTSLIRHVASKRKPMIISTGLGERSDIAAAIEAAISGNPDIYETGRLMLMHCVSAYPTSAEEASVANIRWLIREFGLPVGYSDHTIGIKACELSVAVGAGAIEKHFTYRKEDQTFHDHLLSANPEDMRNLVSRIREAEILLGTEERRRSPSEENIIGTVRRSIAMRCDIAAGAVLREDALTCLRPGNGIPAPALDSLVGRRVRRNLAAGELIAFDDLQD